MSRLPVFIFLFFLPCALISGELKKADSLKILLSQSKSDTQQIRLMNNLAWQIQYNHPDSALKISLRALELSEKLRNKFLIAKSLTILGSIWDEKSETDKSIDCYKKALQIFEEIGDKNNIAKVLFDLGVLEHTAANYSMSMEFYTRSLKMYEEKGEKISISEVMSAMGKVYKDIGRLSDALDYELKAQKLSEDTGDKNWNAKVTISVGLLYIELKKYPEALQMFEKVKPVFENSDDIKGRAILYTNIGNVYFYQKDYVRAIENYEKSLAYARQIGNLYGTALLQLNIGSVYHKQANYAKAKEYYDQAEKTSRKIKARDMLVDIYSNVSEMYSDKKEFEKAFFYHAKYSSLKDSLLNESGNRQVQELTKKYESDKKEKEILSLTRDKATRELAFLKQENDLNKQRLISIASIAGVIVLIGFAFLLYNRYKLKQRANEQLHSRNEAISLQKGVIEEKNRNITDSINYASRIQTALLPDKQHFRTSFTDAFIVFNPKDIVSGDFYWITEMEKKIIYATADCTGHGVPGGFMTMLGISLLNEIVNDLGISSPASILDELRKKVIYALKQKNYSSAPAGNSIQDNPIKDGMDITVCCINKQDGELTYASAYQDICIVSNGKLIELSGDKQPIGYFGEMGKPFTERKYSLREGDMIYTFTDGYADQFGGPKGKKFKYKNLVQLFLTHHTKPGTEQKILFENILKDWRGGLEQIDDICLLGVRI